MDIVGMIAGGLFIAIILGTCGYGAVILLGWIVGHITRCVVRAWKEEMAAEKEQP